ncbi:hypothetical protein [Streptomyces sp. NPDC050560]|uniref:hypothetical protein n=1 Tax=Streptomyces sp. NPDC050560 TaxID=3365630 RepID=UPI003799F71C
MRTKPYYQNAPGGVRPWQSLASLGVTESDLPVGRGRGGREAAHRHGGPRGARRPGREES